jgi:endonuclease YncB( thermonuclease family)
MRVLFAAFIALFVPCVYSQGSMPYKVLDVLDAETVVLVSPRDDKSTVRIAGIDAPEKDQPFGKESFDQLIVLIKGKEITSELIKIDGKSLFVSRIRLDGEDIGLKLIQTGYAWHRNERGELPPADMERYAAAQLEAKSNKVGLWATDAVDPKDWRKAAAAKVLSSAVPKETFVGIVSTKYYYAFHCDEAKFDPDEEQKMFNTEEDAQKAGFKKATVCSKPRPIVAPAYRVETQPIRSARATKIIELTSDYSSFRDKLVTVQGEVSMSTIFVGEFIGEDELFYSFRIADGTDAILGFAPKNSGAAKLRQALLQNDDATMWTKVRIKIIGRTVGGTIYGSLIEYDSR